MEGDGTASRADSAARTRASVRARDTFERVGPPATQPARAVPAKKQSWWQRGTSWLKNKASDAWRKTSWKAVELGQRAARGVVSLAGPGRSTLADAGKTFRIDVPNAARQKPPIMYVNGALQNVQSAKSAARAVGETAHRNVDLIYNATHVPQYDNPILRTLSAAGHSRKDAYEVLGDHLGKGKNPAVASVKSRALERMQSGLPMHVAAQSAGALITARGLNEAVDARRGELTEQHGAAGAERRMRSELARIKVLNISGAARESDFPKGIRYEHIELPGDPVSRALGEAAGPGRDDDYLWRLQSLSYGLVFSGKDHAIEPTLDRFATKVDRFL